MDYTKITSIEHLKELTNGKQDEFFILLNGNFRSSKTIEYIDNEFHILHQIDDSDETITELELSKSFIAEAIEKGAFYLYD